MTAPAVWFNGQNVRDLGLIVGDLPRFLEAPIRTLPGQPVPGRAGGVHLGRGLHEMRELVVEGTFVRDTAALREAAEEAVKAIVAIGLVEVRVRDARGGVKVAHGVHMNRAPLAPIGGLFVTRGSRWTVSFACEEATWRAEEPVILALSSTRTAFTLGTAATDFIARAHGGGTSMQLTFATAGGVTTADLSLGDTAADEYVEVHGNGETVEEFDSGVVANGLARIGDDPFPEYGLTPADGDGQTVVLTGGAVGDLWYWPRTT